MIIKTSTTLETTWDALKAAAVKGLLDRQLRQNDLLPIALKNGEEAAVRATQDRDGKWFFVLEDCLADEHRMNKCPTNKGAWAACDMRQYLNKTVFSLLPDELQEVIAPTKIIQIVDSKRVETEDKPFLLSKTQVFGESHWTVNEPEDAQLLCFLREKDRVKECDNKGTWFWWLRSLEASSSSAFHAVYYAGSSYTGNANYSYGVVFGFCLI